MAEERGFISSQEWLTASLKLLAHLHSPLSAPLQSVTLLSAITEQDLASAVIFLLHFECKFYVLTTPSPLILSWGLLFIVYLLHVDIQSKGPVLDVKECKAKSN